MFLVLLVLHLFQLVLYYWVLPPLTWTQFFAVLDGNTFHRTHIPIEQIATNMQLAVIAAEDQLFARHNGIDVDSIKKAIIHNKKGKHIRGASTISQQVAKNAFLWQQRSWFRKGLEVYYTFVMEQFYGKQRILEMYLNITEMGPGIFGIEAAAKHYFRKSSSKLNTREAALLAACLPNPKRYNPASPNAHMKKKADWIVSQMKYLKTRPNTKQLLYGK